MSADLEREARELAYKDQPAADFNSHAFRHFVRGYYVGAFPREEEIATLRARVAELEKREPKWIRKAEWEAMFSQEAYAYFGWNKVGVWNCNDTHLVLLVPPTQAPETKP